MRILAARDKAEKELHVLINQLREAQEEERRRIASELHDDIGQQITLLSFLLNRIGQLLEKQVPVDLTEVQKIAAELIGKVRDLSVNLSPAMLDDVGFLATLQWYLQDFSKKTGIQIDFRHSGLERELPRRITLAAYRIIQETMTNVIRHVKANRLELLIQVNKKTLDILVQDGGIGFDPAAVPGTSTALYGIRQRAQYLGGTFKLGLTPGKATKITVKLPFLLLS